MSLYINGIQTGGGGGGNADVVHLTQDEYDALPSSKLSDDKIYMIEDVTSKEVEGEHYSTNEQIVGTWVDGSPVYQKTYVATIDTQYSSEPAYDLGTVPSGFDVLVSAEGSVRTQNGVGYTTFAGIDNINGWSFGFHITSGHLMLYGGNGNISQMSAIVNGTAVATIKYTKSAS